MVRRRRRRALRRVVESRVADKYRNAIRIHARRVECRINDAEIEILGEKRLLIRSSQLKVIDTLHIGNIGAQSRVRQRPILRDSVLLQIGRTKVGEWVLARIVIEGIPPRPPTETKDDGRTRHSRPSRRDVEALNERPLVGGADHVAVRIETAIGHHHFIPQRRILPVKAVGRLEPRT